LARDHQQSRCFDHGPDRAGVLVSIRQALRTDCALHQGYAPFLPFVDIMQCGAFQKSEEPFASGGLSHERQDIAAADMLAEIGDNVRQMLDAVERLEPSR
jgi:hypothetical protein